MSMTTSLPGAAQHAPTPTTTSPSLTELTVRSGGDDETTSNRSHSSSSNNSSRQPRVSLQKNKLTVSNGSSSSSSDHSNPLALSTTNEPSTAFLSIPKNISTLKPDECLNEEEAKHAMVVSSSSSNSSSSTSSALSSSSSFISTHTALAQQHSSSVALPQPPPSTPSSAGVSGETMHAAENGLLQLNQSELLSLTANVAAAALSHSNTLSSLASGSVQFRSSNESTESMEDQLLIASSLTTIANRNSNDGSGGEPGARGNRRSNTSNLSEDSPDFFKKNQFGSFKESNYKQQKENYLVEKKKITNDILTIMRDERIILLADWLKIRGSFKNWIKLYCILKPGILQLFKSDKTKPGQWVGTIVLNSCQLIQRPSKKHGFCFKLFHPLERSIWASKGPAGETYINLPYMLLPTFYLIFRAPSEKTGSVWMEAIELALKSSHLIKSSNTTTTNSGSITAQPSNATLNNLVLNSPLASGGGAQAIGNNNNSIINNNNNTLNSSTCSDLLNDSFKSNRSDTFNSIKSSSSSSGPNTATSFFNTTATPNGITATATTASGPEHTSLSARNSKEEDHIVLTESDYNKNSSGDGEEEEEDDDEEDDEEEEEEEEEDECSFNSSTTNNMHINEERPRRPRLHHHHHHHHLDEYDEDFYYDNHLTGANSKKEATTVALPEAVPEHVETEYCPSPSEEFGENQTEEVGDENKSLLLCLVKQVRPGMDLSKVVLPTFILEPRSFLEKLSDFYYHSDILSACSACDDPYERMKLVIKFYLSGFYKKPKGLKKPYNPVLGEVFRTYWLNPATGSKTFYVAEQVSHHPPVTSFYVSNRQDGYCIHGTVLARSKFYGNSVSAILEGCVKIILLSRGEEYLVTMPYANCKGILIGKMTMELGGKVKIECAKTGYSADIEFKLKPLLSSNEASNHVEGKIRFADKEVLGVLTGKWDGEMVLHEKLSGERVQLWNPTKEVIERRLKRFVVPVDKQSEFESERLWLKVSEAIRVSDQYLATEEKTKIEARQRQDLAAMLSNGAADNSAIHKRKFFTFSTSSKEWIYNFSDLRPWDPQTDQFQFESDFCILTKTKHNLRVASRIIGSTDHARTSLLSMQRRQRTTVSGVPGLVSSSLASSVVTAPVTATATADAAVTNAIDSNEFISENESYDLIDHYAGVKSRLDQIEAMLTKLSVKVDTSTRMVERAMLSSAMTSRDQAAAAAAVSWSPVTGGQSGLAFFVLVALFTSILLSVFMKNIL